MRFPRVRGDVPSFHLAADQATRFSPRARGCSGVKGTMAGTAMVFPACAGMFRTMTMILPTDWGFPRVHGDVPPAMSRPPLAMFVFPACAGMFPQFS